MAEPWPPGRVAVEDGELMPQGEDLRLEVEARPKAQAEGGEQGDERRGHPGRERYQAWARICNEDKTFGVFGRDNAEISP